MSSTLAEPTDIRQHTKDRLIEMVRSVNKDGQWKVMVCDHYSLRIISAACNMFDIMEEGISIVESLELSRQPFKSMDALYFVSPTKETIDIINNDFKDVSEPQYRSIHLYFTSPLSDILMNELGTRTVRPRVQSLVELNIDFLATEQRVFHFDRPLSFGSFLDPDHPQYATEMRTCLRQMFTVCASLGELPYIRYQANRHSCRDLAFKLHEQLEAFASINPNFPSTGIKVGVEGPEATNRREKATLLILDRTVDPLAPLAHEFTYQAMAYDLLPIQENKYNYKFEDSDGQVQEKLVMLDDKDHVWVQLRHMHIVDAIKIVTEDLNKFLRENQNVMAFDSHGKIGTLNQMRDALRAMPQFQEKKSKYALHVDVVNSCMEIFEKTKLSVLGNLEQNFLCGEDPLGKPLNMEVVIQSLSKVLQDETYSELDKTRLLMLMNYCLDLPPEVNSSMLQMIDISHGHLTAIRRSRMLRPAHFEEINKSCTRKARRSRREEMPYDLSRFIPYIKTLATSMVKEELDLDYFPFISEPIGLRNRRPKTDAQLRSSLKCRIQPSWATRDGRRGKKKEEKVEVYGGRVIILVLGGVTYSEIRSAYELVKQIHKDVIIGSTGLINPEQYVQNIIDLDQA